MALAKTKINIPNQEKIRKMDKSVAKCEVVGREIQVLFTSEMNEKKSEKFILEQELKMSFL